MESYEMDTIKMEKEKAMRRYRTFRKIANTVRTLEIFVAIMLISWTFSFSSSYFPAAVEFTVAFLRRAFSFLLSPRFVFVLGNAIVITLFVKSSSGGVAGDDSSAVNSPEIHNILSGDVVVPVVSEERESKMEVVEAVKEEARESEIVAVRGSEIVAVNKEEEKTYRRTQSSVEMAVVEIEKEKEKKKKELRRSETEPRRKIGSPAAARRGVGRVYEVDELSSDEFRRKVEAFIEKQQRLLREERHAVVVTN